MITLLLIIFSLSGTTVHAETTLFRQQILPIDCIYEVIDVGTQQLRYITPATCPVDPGPPVITEPPVSSTEGEQTVTDDLKINRRWLNQPSVSLRASESSAVPNYQNVDTKESVQGLLGRAKDNITRNNDALFVTAVSTTLIIAGSIFLIRRKLVRRDNNKLA